MVESLVVWVQEAVDALSSVASCVSAAQFYTLLVSEEPLPGQEEKVVTEMLV